MFHSAVRPLSVSERHYENGNLKKEGLFILIKNNSTKQAKQRSHNNGEIYETQPHARLLIILEFSQEISDKKNVSLKVMEGSG